MFSPVPFRLLSRKSTDQSVRFTWVLRRIFTPDVTSDVSLVQKNPNEMQNYQKYQVVEVENQKPAQSVKVILLQDVEGIGHQFDIVNVSSESARKDLLLSRKGVYASSFDLQYYADMKEKMTEELSRRVRVPYELKVVARELQKMVVLIKVSMNVTWTINRRLIRSSLRQSGVFVAEDCIYLPGSPITGPSFDIEANLLRFYVVISKKFIVPMIGRITHISVDEAKQILSPSLSNIVSDKELRKHGLRQEKPAYSESAEFDCNFDVINFMQKQ